MDQKTLQAVYDAAILFRNAFADVEDVCNAIMDGTMPSTGKKPFYVGVNADGLMLGAHPYGDMGAEFRAITSALPGYAGPDPISGKILDKTYQHLSTLLKDPDGTAAEHTQSVHYAISAWDADVRHIIQTWDGYSELCLPGFKASGSVSDAAEQLDQKFRLEKGLSISDVIFGVEDGPRGISQMFDTILAYLQWHQDSLKKPQEPARPGLQPKNRI